MTETNGKLIEAMGIPCCGKSTIVRLLAKHFNTISFHEPEENEWAEAVLKREQCGYITSITWFRSIRVPQLYNAHDLAKKGQVVFIDSYYDKLIHYYLGKPGLQWLIPEEDKYYEVFKDFAKVDYYNLPNADIILFFNLTIDVWESFLEKRNRALDNNLNFREQCFALQAYMLEACSS